MPNYETFVAQFGEKVFSPSNDTELSPKIALEGKEHVLIYFSAHWCPPCRQFTPILIEFYKKLKSSGTNIELVFCSLDRDENDYKEYIFDMPWLCMPFEAKESKKLASLYEARGIPHLVVVDKDGKLVTKNGNAEVSSDLEGKEFPWKPKTFSEVWPDQILVSKGEGNKEDILLDSSEIKDKYLMLYFSASWCPPCQAFTPILAKAYDKLKTQRNDVELVFVSSDRDEEAFNEYFVKKMSFCALPYKEREAKKALSSLYEVKGIPALVILGPEEKNGERALINKNIRHYIENDDFSDFPFHKKNYGDVDASQDLNEVKSLIIFAENSDDDEQKDVQNVIKEVASKLKDEESEKEMDFLWAFSPNGIASKVREVTGLSATDTSMIILDIPDEGAYYKSEEMDFTTENVLKFIENPGNRLQLQ